MVIGLSSSIGTRRRIRMSSHGENCDDDDEEDSNDEPTDWEKMAQNAIEDRKRYEAWVKEMDQKHLAEIQEQEQNWENLSDAEKRKFVAERMQEFLFENAKDKWVEWDDGFFKKPAPAVNEEYKAGRHKVFSAAERYKFGKGSKDIKILEKTVIENPELQDRVDYLIGRIKEVDAHNGLTPIEYMRQQSKKQ